MASRRAISRAFSVGWSTPQGKRTFGNLFMAVSALAVTVLLGSPEPGLWGVIALVSMFLAWLFFHAAGQQERSEATAQDRLEWLREAISFRRAVGPIWKRLDGKPFREFARAVEFEGTFEELLDGAGWPDTPGEHVDLLREFMKCCLPPPGAEIVIPELKKIGFLNVLRREDLVAEWQRVKDILEVWSVALDLGGSRAPALREVIRSLSDNHLNSIRLIWFLSIAHTAHHPPPSEPDYSFVSRVRDVMVTADPSRVS